MNAVLHVLAASNVPVPKDVVIATTGASAALGGLVLVFVGLLVTSVGALGMDSVATVRTKRRKPVWLAVAVFCVCVTSVALGFWWLETGGGSTLYAINNAVFTVELLGIVAISIYGVKKAL